MKWQKRLRLVIAVAAVAFAVVVAFAFRRRTPPPPAPQIRTEPGAVVESTGGRVQRFKSSREDVRVEYERQLTYANGSTKLMGVSIVTAERTGSRSFTVTSREGESGQNESMLTLTGDVRLAASDGLTARTEHATYSDKDGLVRATGPVQFTRGRMTGSGTGLTYDVANDVLVILEHVAVQIAPDQQAGDAGDIVAGRAEIARRQQSMQFEGDVKLTRGARTLQSDLATAHLTSDNNRIEAMELRGHSRITVAKPEPGGLQALGSRDMDLKYAADGQTLEHATLLGDGVIFLAGQSGASGRQITAKTIDVTLGPDGATPVALIAREAVQLLLPAETGVPMRTIRSTAMQAEGEPGRGLTHALFSGGAEYRERGSGVDRTATAATLDVRLKPAMSGIDDATFTRGVRFVDGAMTATSAAARYDLEKGTLDLTGSDPAAPRPHVVNDQIAVDATRVDLTLAGPKMKAAGTVKSVLQPPKAGGRGGSGETRLPSLFKQDKPVNVTADALDYDGGSSKATYTGNAQLWQEDTSVKGATLILDDKTGDLTGIGGSGTVATVIMRDQVDKDKKPQRVRSVATAKDFKYEDASHRATYTGNAHLTGPDGDMTAAKIELYLKESGDELDRAEGYDNVTLRDARRTTTGNRLTYTTADQRYVVTGTPVKAVDECRRETIGRTLTYLRDSDVITIDGNDQTRTQTTGAASCP